MLTVVFALWGLWIFAAQLFLWTPLLRSLINAHAPHVRIEYRFAWSIWPGRVNATGFRLIAQDRKLQWQLSLDRLSATVAVADLPLRIFHCTRVRADGIRFAARFRVPGSELTPANLAGLPPIEGFASPLAEEGPSEDIPDWAYHLFSVWLQDVEGTGLREIWFDRVRVDGSMRVAGAFYLKPIRRVLVAPAELWSDGATVAHAGEPVASDLRGHLALRLGEFDPRGIKLPVVMRALDADADLAARLEGLGPLVHAFGESARMEGGAGHAKLTAKVQGGEVLPGSALEIVTGQVSMTTVNDTYQLGDLRVAARVDARSVTQALEASVEVHELRVGPHAAPSAARIRAISVGLQGRAPDLAELRLPERAAVEVEGGESANPGALIRMMPAAVARQVQIERGRARFDARLAGPPHRLSGRAHLAFDGVELRQDGARFGGDALIDVNVRALDPARGADLSGTRLAISNAHLINADGAQDTAPEWWGRAELPRAELRFPRGQDPDELFADADLAAQCRDARPIVGLYARRQQLPGFLRGLFGMDGLFVTGSMVAGRDLLALRDLTAHGDHASIRATWRKQRGKTEGAALFTVRGLSVGVQIVGSGKSVHLLRPGGWFNDEERRLAPQLALKQLPRARRKLSRPRATPLQLAE